MIVKTNVKLNLGLSVLRKRPDGFHDIETLFVPCFDFGDTLEIITSDDYSRTSAALFAKYGEQISSDAIESHKAVGIEALPNPNETSSHLRSERFTDIISTASTYDKAGTANSGQVTMSEDGRLVQGISEDGKLMITIARAEGVDWNPLKDLCTKAYSILAQDFDLPPVKIFLEKTAPVGAGLGGGSADAAFTLKALNELCALNLSDQRLSEYAAFLGSDCSFFIFNRPMIGSGRGELLEPYGIDLSEYDTQVLVPEGIAVSTAEAYKGIVPREASGTSDPISALRQAQCPESKTPENTLCGAAERVTDPTLNSSLTSSTSQQASCLCAGTTECTERATSICTETETDNSPEGITVQCTETETAMCPQTETDNNPEEATTRATTDSLGLREALELPVTEWKGNLVNDFEATVFKAHPELAAIKQSLYDSGAVYASMSGSGSALFALYKK